MIKKILNLENVKKLEKQEQESINGGYILGIYCGTGHPYCCRTCNAQGSPGGFLFRGICNCF
ncbi:hypothetical protein BTO06_07135 [Tenacibaculum sp. SZ-18]|uniref:hypothetical protein n=1 Tax=Tenacibaculum sp. SZ-18 TaxID=754423 RepID=UPI000C2D43B5|nr:hypothetical protein [Tenacibaculum sp. SZ-18]AUC14924.1 hypothetical protein BTO06_07135 [Tenacibaculum sp. SZ-18]